MVLICTYCGSECNERDQANGRCGSCACFFTGNEEVIENQADNEPAKHTETIASPLSIPKSPTSTPSESPEPSRGSAANVAGDAVPVPSQFDPTAVEPDQPHPDVEDSEGLIQPRRLSPQFRRRVEMTWQSTFGGEGSSAESTLSSSTPSTGTKRENPTLSIATRNITREQEQKGNAKSSDYELREVIGEGSMGRVWSATQTSLDREVAVKVPMAELAGAGSVGEGQFISEVVVTGKLEHPNIVPIYELGRDATGLPFYSMKHVQGRPWNELIEDKSDQENIEILMKVCDALAFAHDRNFLHRDIKPHNVMVGEFGEVSVMDWGIAVSINADPDQPWASVATGPAGTPAYMAPEMAAHNPSELGVVSDIYLLGAVLYEIVTGTPPHPRTGSPGKALLAAAANQIIPTTRTGELVDIARRAMATNLDDRYQSVQELQDALRTYQSHRESIKLSESADEHFLQAIQRKDSDEFARSRFAYEEALRLWDGNTAAVTGIETATLAHAQNALEEENFGLGISILDRDNPGHRELLSKLEAKRAARQRLGHYAKLAAATAAVAILSVVVVVTKSYYNEKKNARDLAAKNTIAEQMKTKAELQEGLALESAKEAKQAADEARKAERVAVSAKVKARESETIARQEKRRAEEAAYASAIGLASESIGRNEFVKAQGILSKLSPTGGPDSNTVMSKLRHIEWGILRDSASPATVENLLTQLPIQSVASSLDGTVIAAGTEDGNLFLWRVDPGATTLPEPSSYRVGDSIHSLDVSDDGDFLAVATSTATEDENSGRGRNQIVRVWDTRRNRLDETVSDLIGHTENIVSVSFSRDSTKLVTSAWDRTARVWETTTGRLLSTMGDHMDRRVWSAQFSPSGRYVVTACEDGRVRVWDVSGRSTDATEKSDFRGHDGPVYAAVFTPDGNYVISGGYDQRLLRWKIPFSDDADAPDAGTLLEARLSGNPMEMTDMEQVGQKRDQHDASIHTISVGMVQGEECVLTGGNDNTVRVWSRSGNEWSLNKVLRGHGRWVKSSVFTRNGAAILSGARDGMKLWRWQDYMMPIELFPIAERRLGKRPSELGLSTVSKTTYSKDGRWVASAYENGTVAVWDLKSKDRSASQLLNDGHALLTATGQFYNDGKRLLTSAGDNTTRLWDVDRGTQFQKLIGTGYRGVAAATWRSQSAETFVVTGSDDRMVPAWFWILRDDAEPQRIPLLDDLAKAELARQLGRPDDNQPASDAEIKELLSKVEFDSIRKLKRGIPDVTTVAIASDGRQFMIGNSGGECFLFALDEGDDRPRLVSRFRAHGTSIASAAYLPSGDTVITASSDGQVRSWNASSGEMQDQLKWSGPVTSLAVADNGQHVLVGHAPTEGRQLPVVERFRIDGDQIQPDGQLTNQNSGNTGNWEGNQPTVQSIQFVRGSEQTLVTLYFPTQTSTDELGDAQESQWSGYRMGFWNPDDPDSGFTLIPSSRNGEIASAVLGQDPTGSQLLVVGGKGARLWASEDASPNSFDQLTKSFRPASSIASLDFSFDPDSGSSDRLVVGDAEGNVRIWALDSGDWSEKAESAEHLAGHHQAPLVSTHFNPQNPNELLSADRSGQWKTWVFDYDQSNWTIQQSNESLEKDSADPSVSRVTHLAMYSPDGRFVLIGGDQHAKMWQRNQQGSLEPTLEDWKPGTIQSAVFSADGSWIVTSDGEQNVSFWDSRGFKIAGMDPDNARETSAMAISHDRRRFVTGQGGRIVIWDTARLAQGISELLTLEEHRAVTSVSISPDGRNLLSSGSEGRTIVWTGQPIAPVLISLSSDQIAYELDSGIATFDSDVVLSDPSLLADFGTAKLTVSVRNGAASDQEDEAGSVSKPVGAPRATLSINTTEDQLGASIRVESDGGESSIYYRAHFLAQWQLIGSFQIEKADAAAMQVMLNGNADASAVQTLLRSLAYQIDSPDSGQQLTMFSRLQETGRSETQPLKSWTARIRVSGLRYNDIGQTQPPLEGATRSEQFPSSVEASVTIEVESESTGDSESGNADDLAVVSGIKNAAATLQQVGS